MTQTTVTKIVHGWSNSALRMPFVYAVYACGHSGDCKVKPNTLICDKCGFERDHGVAAYNLNGCPKCGCQVARYGKRVDPHNPTEQVTKVGDEVTCAACDRYVAGLEELKALIASGALSHSRWKNGTVHIYRHEPTSPTGVLLAMSIEDRPEAQALLKGGLSPLSPTEGLPRSGR